MADTSAILALPFILPSQAQKHVTHNEAVQMLDVIVQLVVAGFEAETPPASPTEGEVHALGAAPTGVWAGQTAMLAAYIDNVWRFVIPKPGWRAATPAGDLRLFDGSTWVRPAVDLQEFATLGIQTTADTTNRLSVRAPATLLSHEGAGHQLKINKAAAGETASLLFQSNWSGRAEMGLVGEEAFAIKVSADGSSFLSALRFDPATGHVTGAAVQQAATDITSGRLMRADYGYGPGNLLGVVSQAAGVPTGAVIERTSGSGGEAVRFADGTMICTQVLSFASVATASGALFTSAAQSWTFPASFAAPPVLSGAAEGVMRWMTFGPSSTTAADLALMATASSASAVNARVMAFGRWI
ncbi:DUF2793 domain-containing protein [Rhodobacter maris]|uniref:Uncharacterized protein DUF2793 n=1 Tax=Rhodobacter maris TaxID=446682 RepID=A0A285T9I4_9RHOB|nr:DUF2793 domain-containing protein [Rhodobacter maris]SOC18190.1 uncharacterized protein DUF2793 [Rhodobacter maris]